MPNLNTLKRVVQTAFPKFETVDITLPLHLGNMSFFQRKCDFVRGTSQAKIQFVNRLTNLIKKAPMPKAFKTQLKKKMLFAESFYSVVRRVPGT